MKLSESQLNSLRTAARKYSQALPGSPAEEYLASRGLSLDQVYRFGLGYVAEPDIGHDMFKGRLSIPYARYPLSGDPKILGIKFRRLGDDSGGAKYLGTPGFKPTLFNTVDVIANEDEICICEGELDAISASVNGIPAVAAPGATTWQEKWNPIFYGYETVFVLADGDPLKIVKNCSRCHGECVGHSPGLDFAAEIAENLPNAKIVPMLENEDVNSMIVKYGADKIKEMIGRG